MTSEEILSEPLNKDEKSKNPILESSDITNEDSIEKSDDESNEEELDPYFVDIEKLKDLDLNLSEEQKNKTREEALIDKDKGNSTFKEGNYIEASKHYTIALNKCPLCFTKDRAILYSNRAAAISHLNEKKKAIQDCTKAIELDEKYLKVILRRAKLYEETDSLDEALADFKKVLELDPKLTEAHMAVNRLPPLIEQRNEKLKEEMFDKLKDLGNMVLRPFGLSTNNFKLNQDPDTGGYNIQFQQQP